MTTPSTILSWLTWAAPSIMILSMLAIARCLRWSRQPALLAFLVAEAWIIALDVSREAAILCQMVTGAWLLREMARYARVNLSLRTQAAFATAMVATCGFMAACQDFTSDYEISFLRSELRIARALAALAITLYRWRYPALEQHAESHRNRVYRRGVTAWLVVEAGQGLFIKGILPVAWYSPELWAWVGLITCSAVLAAIVGTAVAMNWSAAPRRVRQVRTGDVWIAVRKVA